MLSDVGMGGFMEVEELEEQNEAFSSLNEKSKGHRKTAKDIDKRIAGVN